MSLRERSTVRHWYPKPRKPEKAVVVCPERDRERYKLRETHPRLFLRVTSVLPDHLRFLGDSSIATRVIQRKNLFLPREEKYQRTRARARDFEEMSYALAFLTRSRDKNWYIYGRWVLPQREISAGGPWVVFFFLFFFFLIRTRAIRGYGLNVSLLPALPRPDESLSA